MGLIAGFGALSLLSLLLFALAGSRHGERILFLAEFPERASDKLRWLGILLVAAALIGYTVVFMIPFMLSFFGSLIRVRLLVFWSISLLGMWGIKLLRKETPWFSVLIAMMLCQATLHLLLLYWPVCHFVPFCYGMVGDKPFLLSFPLSL